MCYRVRWGVSERQGLVGIVVMKIRIRNRLDSIFCELLLKLNLLEIGGNNLSLHMQNDNIETDKMIRGGETYEGDLCTCRDF